MEANRKRWEERMERVVVGRTVPIRVEMLGRPPFVSGLSRAVAVTSSRLSDAVVYTAHIDRFVVFDAISWTRRQENRPGDDGRRRPCVL